MAPDTDARMPVPEVAQVSNPARIVGGLPCLRCGYSLQGLSVADRCPECGEAAAATARDHLLFRSEGELARLRRSATLVGVAGLLPVLALASMFVFGIALWLGRSWVPTSLFKWWIDFAYYGVLAICPWVGFAGWWGLVGWLKQYSAEVGAVAHELGSTRVTMRLRRAMAMLGPLALLFAAGAFAALVTMIAGASVLTIRGEWMLAPLALLGALWCVRNAAAMTVIGELARRASVRRVIGTARFALRLNLALAVGSVVVGLILHVAVSQKTIMRSGGPLEQVATVVAWTQLIGLVAAVVLNIGLAMALRTMVGRVLRLRAEHGGKFIAEAAATSPVIESDSEPAGRADSASPAA